MKKETAEKAHKLLEEIENLKRYGKLTGIKNYNRVAHFEVVQHYGDCKEYERVQIEPRHNKRLIVELDKIILELESELSEM